MEINIFKRESEASIMSPKWQIWILLAAALILPVIAGCGNEGNGDTAWQFQQNIKQPIKATVGIKSGKLGKLDADKVQVSIPGKTFEKNIDVSLSNPKSVPKFVGKEMTPAGSPIEISAGDKPVRLDKPVTITMKFDNSKFKKEPEPTELQVVYFDGGQWEYIRAKSIDFKAGTVTFETYHFSFFGTAKVSVEEQIKQITHNAALANVIQSNVDDKVDKMAEAAIDNLLTGLLGMKDDATKTKILSSLLKDDDYKDLYDKFKDGDVAGVNQTLNVFIGKKISENLGESRLNSVLGALADSKGVEYAEAASQSLGALAAGNYKDAARIIGEKIADEFTITIAVKVAAEAIQYEIDSWKDSEIEAAYKAYKNGADGKFWGYNVDKGDFGALWDQMRGISTRLQSEAITRENKIREEAGMPPLTDREMDKLRDKVKADLKKQFDRREAMEVQIAKEQEKLNKLVDAYKTASLLDSGMFGYSSNMDTLESRLEKLFHFKDKVLRDIGRHTLTDGAFSTKGALSMNDLVSLTQAWFGDKDGYKKYADMIKEKFGIDIYPPAEQIGGHYAGNLIITNIDLPKVDQPPATSESSEGCDLSGLGEAIVKQIESMKGKPIPIELDLQGGASGSFGMVTAADPKEKQAMPASQYQYSYGHIETTISQEGTTIKLVGNISKADGGFRIDGTWSAPFGDKGSMSGTWTATKSQ